MAMYTLKKSLGQHFLKDEQVSQRIVASLREHPFQRLLEVGPGGGALTKYLMRLEDVDFKAVELDQEKIAYLLGSYPALAGKLIPGSILDIPLPFEAPFTLVGNFPYNISSQILFRVLEWKDHTEAVVGMFQKEVAQRVAAREGSRTYGILSILVQTFFRVEYLFEVGEDAFVPPPKVKSAVIRLLPRIDVPGFRTEEHLRRLVKTAFNQRRKMLRNAVKGLFPPEVLADPLFDKRAEHLSVEEFALLTHRMS
jgi:16S rRNA (adenine1518-N6/adenine1519-N6)-dimethyltransferase